MPRFLAQLGIHAASESIKQVKVGSPARLDLVGNDANCLGILRLEGEMIAITTTSFDLAVDKICLRMIVWLGRRSEQWRSSRPRRRVFLLLVAGSYLLRQTNLNRKALHLAGWGQYLWRSWRVVCSSHVGKCYHDVDYGMNSDHRAYQASISTMLNYTKSATQPILYNNTESDGPIFSLAGMTGFEEYKVSSLPWKETLPLVYTEDWWARKCWIHVHTCSGTLGVNQMK